MAKTLGERILWGVALALFLAFILWWGIYGPEYAPGPTSTPTTDVANNSGQKTALFVARQLAMAAKTGNHGWCVRFTDEELVAALEYLEGDEMRPLAIFLEVGEEVGVAPLAIPEAAMTCAEHRRSE